MMLARQRLLLVVYVNTCNHSGCCSSSAQSRRKATHKSRITDPPLTLCNDGGFGGAYPATLQASLATSRLLRPLTLLCTFHQLMGGPRQRLPASEVHRTASHGGGQRQACLVPFWVALREGRTRGSARERKPERSEFELGRMDFCRK
jgi:hypothetical protein